MKKPILKIKPNNKEKIEEKDENVFVNYYETDAVKAHIVPHHNPSFNFQTQPIKHPFRMCIVGASGSGKSNILFGLLRKLDQTFNGIKLFVQDKDEPLYKTLQDAIPKPYLEIYEGIDSVKEVNYDELEGQYLFIFDDFVIESEKKHQKICELYIRGRKMSKDNAGISLIYLTQSYYETPSTIRKQCTHLILKKVMGKMERNAIIRDINALDINKHQLDNLYHYCVGGSEDISNFLFIDKSAKEGFNFRKNLNEILDIEQF